MWREYNFYVYIMASDSGTLYVGFTNNLILRVMQHRQGLVHGFTKKYGRHKLIYFEHYTDVYTAMAREIQLKKWRREKKEWLIGQMNPGWKDLYQGLLDKQ